MMLTSQSCWLLRGSIALFTLAAISCEQPDAPAILPHSDGPVTIAMSGGADAPVSLSPQAARFIRRLAASKSDTELVARYRSKRIEPHAYFDVDGISYGVIPMNVVLLRTSHTCEAWTSPAVQAMFQANDEGTKDLMPSAQDMAARFERFVQSSR